MGAGTGYDVTDKGAGRLNYRVRALNQTGASDWSNTQTVDVCWEAEPNDTYATANGPLLFDRTTFAYPNDDKDYFSLWLPADGQLRIDVANMVASSAQVQLFQGVADPVHRVGFDADPPFALNYKGPAGWYYLYVSNDPPFQSTSAYTIYARHSDMAYVPAGPFFMGSDASDPEADENEKPLRYLTSGAFWIDRTEVTNADFKKCVLAGECSPPTKCDSGPTSLPTYGDATTWDHPVVCVPWEDAAHYCYWMGKRLPKESEWEKAARGPDGRRYPWGEGFDGSQANSCDINCDPMFTYRDIHINDGFAFTAPASAFAAGASPYGALNMSGNVWEWVEVDGDLTRNDQVRQRSTEPGRAGATQWLKSGSWSNLRNDLRSARRLEKPATLRSSDTGFRCAR